MIRGWYTGASGMNAQQNRLDAISNNLANVDTAGYKRDVAASRSFPELLLRRTNADGVYQTPFGSADAAPVIGKLGLGVETNENYTDFTQGSFRETNSNTDLAFSGEGFFAVQTPVGERYTRDGNFIVGKEGILETKEGYPVLGENGYIRVADDRFTVNEDGMIYAADGNEAVDRLKVVRFDNERYLVKMGGNLYGTNDIAGAAHIAEGRERPKLIQGYIETSNVNVVNEMVQMIEVNRAYEANQKTITSEDSMMGTLWSKTAVFK
ncbi:MAG: flagellar basal-body rod protein FlgF [Treponemataceae bacterium]|nr:flagellar basal-body rod protein FlgF [Treponemataceae bacterium]